MSEIVATEPIAPGVGRSSSIDNRKEKERSRRDHSSDRRRDSRDRGSRRDRDRSPDRMRRDRDRSPDRRRDRDRSPDRRRRDRSPDRSRRDRSPERRRDRDRSRERSPDRSRRDRDRSPKKDKDGDREKTRERSPPVDREELKRRREIEDLTKDQRTIFVSQLIKKTNEQSLENFFGAIGKVKNIIMIRDKNTGAHKGFAYVEMADLESIPNCLLFNNVVPDFQKFPILVKASEAEKNFLAKKDPFSTTYQPDASILAQTSAGEDARLYIGNVHISVDESVLRTLLEQFGPTESVKLHKDHLGNSKGFAFVKYLRAESASKASAALAGQEFMGRPLKVGPVIDQKANAIGGTGVGGPSAYGGAPDNASNWKLDADEGGAGMSLNSSSRMALMAKLGQSAGLAPPVMQAMPSAPLMPVVPAAPAPGGIPPVSGVPSVNLLVCNMFDPATETEPEWDLDIKEDMMEECSKHGQVEHVHVEKQKPGGIVLLKFATVEAAARAAQSLNGRFFAGRMITAAYIDNNVFSSLML